MLLYIFNYDNICQNKEIENVETITLQYLIL